MALIKQYLNTKYNTIYFPFKANGIDEGTSQSISSNYNFGGNKKIEIGGGKTSLDDNKIQSFYGSYCKARALIGFDTDNLDSSLSSESSLTANLRLYNLPSLDYTPSSLTLEFYPLTANWDAGTFYESTLELGYSNWWNRTQNNAWSTAGGWDVDVSLSSEITLNPSNDHIVLSITNLIRHSLSSGTRYYGYLIKLPNSDESSTANINFRKQIYTGDFSLPNKFPVIDIQYDDYIKDDRQCFIVGTECRLYYYNILNGIPSNINYSAITASIKDQNDITITSTTAVTLDNTNGYYYVDLTIPISAWKENKTFKDHWNFNFNGTQIEKFSYLNVINVLDNNFEMPNSKKLKLSLAKQESHKLINFYLNLSENKFLFFRNSNIKDNAEIYIPNEVHFRVYAYHANSEKEKYYLTEWDRISKDKNGFNFELNKEMFTKGKYFIEFKINIFGSVYYFADRKHYFKVDEDFVQDQSW